MSQLFYILTGALVGLAVLFVILCSYVWRTRDKVHFRAGTQMLARVRSRDCALYIARLVDRGAPELKDVVEYARIQAVYLVRDVNIADDLAGEQAHDLLAILTDLLDQPDADALVLSRMRSTAGLLAQLLTVEPAGALPTWQTIRGASRLSRRLVDHAVRMLPAVHRMRYDEELRSELAELVETSSRWRQLVYAVRLLSRSGWLRRELRGKHRGRIND